MLQDVLLYVPIFLFVLALEQAIASIASVVLVMLLKDLLINGMIFEMTALSFSDLLVEVYLLLTDWSSLRGHSEANPKGPANCDIEHPSKCFYHYI